MYEKFNFSGFVVKAAESHFAGFCSLLQIFWAEEKAQWFIPIGPWFLRRWYLYFCCVFWYGYYTRKKIIDITTNKDKPICAVKTDFVSQVYIIRIKVHEQNKNTVGAKTRSRWEWVFTLFLLPKRFAVNWRIRGNATRQFLLQIRWKFIFRTRFDC